MEDGLLLCCLCSSSLPIRRISIAHSQFHPPIHPDGAPTRRAPRGNQKRVELRMRKGRGGVPVLTSDLISHARARCVWRNKGRSRVYDQQSVPHPYVSACRIAGQVDPCQSRALSCSSLHTVTRWSGAHARLRNIVDRLRKMGSERLITKCLEMSSSAGGGVEDMCVLCKRTHASRRAPESITKALPFFIFCRAHAGYVLVLTHWPGLDTYGSSPAYDK